jgi:hypothetical protein
VRFPHLQVSDGGRALILDQDNATRSRLPNE